MKQPINYTDQYNSMSPEMRRSVLASLQRWGGWTRKTVYLKMAGNNLSPMEEVLFAGVFRMHEHRKDQQLELQFVWDDVEATAKIVEVKKPRGRRKQA